MNRFDRLSVLHKLLLSFACLIMFGACLGATGIGALAKMHGIAAEIGAQHLDGIYYLGEATRNKLNTDLAAANLSFADNAGREKLKEGIRESLANMHRAVDQARTTIAKQDGQTLFDEIAARAAEWESIVQIEVGARPMPAGMDQAELVRQAIGASEKLRDSMMRLGDQKRALAVDAQHRAANEYETMRWVMIALVVGSIATGGALAVVIARRLAAQLGGEPAYAVEVANRIAAGNLAGGVCVRPGDSDSMLHSLANMSGRLADIVGGIRTSSESILHASREIAQGNTDLSQRTEEQAASLQETASSMEELTSTVRQNAENAQQASGLARSASEVSAKGGELVDGVVETMRDLAAGSKRMMDIIAVIEGIAFQTNILALNAAVEAARAGEEGRGFAVVAGEVRSLAQRSALSAKEIKELIDNSTARVTSGALIAEQAGETMAQVMHAVERVTSMMTEISAASNEQSTGIEQVNLAVAQMDRVTQQNAALVEQAAAAAGAMADQAAHLKSTVAVFKLEASSV
ncbi:chemotaxis protein [Burkholderia sp. Leaf177]|uniref:methyl-accepting chemotaxis protein n=1 Tax=Burkholderia sp. Leaf177 TaxID=1736287 RepID=UPI0007021433|nr:methyl-accepting chemotaxis protein [Burkholderia sp. Leaf177]KQR81717.1 chemotaxis protein [Burkholderia sp. Leaf177]